MKREIKFRYYHNNWGMSYPMEFGDWDKLSHNYDAGIVSVMQYTGLKDKNRKDIYEGDIISFCNRLYEVIINFNGYYLQSYKLWNGKFLPAFHYSLSLITKPSKDRFGGEVEKAEIIGNIYNNPELLSKLNEP